jgi:hypothetical protein
VDKFLFAYDHVPLAEVRDASHMCLLPYGSLTRFHVYVTVPPVGIVILVSMP